MGAGKYIEVEYDRDKVKYDSPKNRMRKIKDFISVKVDQGADHKDPQDICQKYNRNSYPVDNELLNRIIEREKPKHATESHDFNDPRTFIIDGKGDTCRIFRNKQDHILIIGVIHTGEIT